MDRFFTQRPFLARNRWVNAGVSTDTNQDFTRVNKSPDAAPVLVGSLQSLRYCDTPDGTFPGSLACISLIHQGKSLFENVKLGRRLDELSAQSDVLLLV